MPIRFLFPFSRLFVLPAPAGGDGKFRDGRAALGELGLGILAEVPHQNHFVDASGCHIILHCNT